jgi:hypothetical protein
LESLGIQGLVTGNYLTKNEFMKAKNPETIRRTRQKVVENMKKKGLGHKVMPDKIVETLRQSKNYYFKGQFPYQERL